MFQVHRSRRNSVCGYKNASIRSWSRSNVSFDRSLHLEELEDRRLLAVFSVTNLLDAGIGSLRAAIAQANSTPGRDEITFVGDASAGTIALSTGELEVSETLTIIGPGEGLLKIDAQHNSRVLNYSSRTGDLSISGLTMQNGHATVHDHGGSGGGIQFYSSGTLTLSNITVRSNTSDGQGGGVCASGNTVINNSTLSANTSVSHGGGIFSNSVTLNNSKITGNASGGDGGAVATFFGAIELNGSTVDGNVSCENGGGVFTSYSGPVTLADSTVSRNTSGAGGGGIFTYFADIMLARSTVSGNSTTGENANGGGIHTSAGAVTLADSTVTGNMARQSVGGGVFVAGADFQDSPLTLQNSILAGNIASAASDLRHAPGSTLWVDYSLIGDNSSTTLAAAPVGSPNVQGNLIGTAINPIDPLLQPLADNGGPTYTHALLLGSPALDAGNSNRGTDQRGMTRAVDFLSAQNVAGGNGSDMGAFEQQTLADSTLPESVTALFEASSDLDLSPSLLVDETEGVISVSLSVSLGAFGVPGDGTTFGVTAFQLDSQTVVLTGKSWALNRYLDTASNLTYTPAAGVAGVRADLIDVTAWDDVSSTNVGTIAVDIAEFPSLEVTTTADRLDELDFVTSLREAILLANTTPGSDKITFDASLSGQEIMLDQGQLLVTSSLEIDAAMLEQNVTINARQQSRVVRIDDLLVTNEDFDVTLAGLTVTGGNSGFHIGAGILFRSSGTLAVNQSIVSRNTTAALGAGIYTYAGDVVLSDSTIAGNTTHSDGGGIFTHSGNVTLSNSTVSDNMSGDDGGGIKTFSGAVTLNESTVSGNRVVRNVQLAAGGGIYTHSGPITLWRSSVRGNSSEYLGGGIFTFSGEVKLTSSTVSDNHSYAGAGGIHAGGSVTLATSAITGNSGLAAGGIKTSGGAVTLSNSTISGNASGHHGGGIFTKSGRVSLANSTVTQNAATALGGGVYVGNGNFGPLLLIENSIVAGNLAANSPDLRPNPNSMLAVDHSLIGDASSGLTSKQLEEIVAGDGNLLDIDPLLGTLAENGGPTLTHQPLPASPAIDAGNPTVMFIAGEYDQRGPLYRRVSNSRVDIGSVESQPSSDFNLDGDVDGADFLAWQRGFRSVAATKSNGDADNDTDVDAVDQLVWQEQYGQAATPSSSVVVALDADLVDAVLAVELTGGDDEEEQTLDAAEWHFSLLQSAVVVGHGRPRRDTSPLAFVEALEPEVKRWELDHALGEAFQSVFD